MDPDIKAIFAAGRALKGSSSKRMLGENLRFLAGHFGYVIVEDSRSLVLEPRRLPYDEGWSYSATEPPTYSHTSTIVTKY